jgi:response regulator of citrate/malate metabolism
LIVCNRSRDRTRNYDTPIYKNHLFGLIANYVKNNKDEKIISINKMSVELGVSYYTLKRYIDYLIFKGRIDLNHNLEHGLRPSYEVKKCD